MKEKHNKENKENRKAVSGKSGGSGKGAGKGTGVKTVKTPRASPGGNVGGSVGVGGGGDKGESAASPGKLKLRKCAAKGCEQLFVPVVDWQLYHSKTCSNRDRQRLMREDYRRMKKEIGENT